MSFLTNRKCNLCLDKEVLALGGGVIPLVDKYGKVLANIVQVLKPTMLSPGIEAQVYCGLATEPCRPVGLVNIGIKGDSGVAVAATVCR